MMCERTSWIAVGARCLGLSIGPSLGRDRLSVSRGGWEDEEVEASRSYRPESLSVVLTVKCYLKVGCLGIAKEYIRTCIEIEKQPALD